MSYGLIKKLSGKPGVNLKNKIMFKNTYKNKKVLITGHTGFKGSWLSFWLINLGADVIGYSNEIPTNPSLFSTLELDQKMNHNIGDVRDYQSIIDAVRGVDFIFHAVDY